MSGNTYFASGVYLDEMDGLKDRIKAFSAMTHGPEVLDSAGGFAGLFQLAGCREPVLVASADGVGTKLKVAAQLGHFESVGQDLVSLNVNDILTKGARPLFFLDYISFSDLDQQRMETLMRGIVWGCREVGCALIGGETAQMPGLYSGGDFDLAGFVVGVAERQDLLDPSSIAAGDCVLGFPSSGVHTNGFSLVRSVFDTDANPSVLHQRFAGLPRQLGEELLIRHRCYYPHAGAGLAIVQGFGAHHRRRSAGKAAGHHPRWAGGGTESRLLDRAAHLFGHPVRGPGFRLGDVPSVQHGPGHGGGLRPGIGGDGVGHGAGNTGRGEHRSPDRR